MNKGEISLIIIIVLFLTICSYLFYEKTKEENIDPIGNVEVTYLNGDSDTIYIKYDNFYLSSKGCISSNKNFGTETFVCGVRSYKQLED